MGGFSRDDGTHFRIPEGADGERLAVPCGESCLVAAVRVHQNDGSDVALSQVALRQVFHRRDTLKPFYHVREFERG